MRLLEFDRDAFFARRTDWDALVARSRTPSVFLTSAWLRASADTVFDDAPVRAFVLVDPTGWRGALALVLGPSGWTLLGAGSSDYLDMPIDRGLTDAARDDVARRLLDAALASTGAASVSLPGVPIEAALHEHLELGGVPHAITARTVAPTMERRAFASAARKKSLKRHWNRLHREGDVRVVTHRTAEDVAPLLDAFFAQHRARWAHDGLPSQFDDPAERLLFHALAVELAAIGALRYTEVRLDGALVAAHFGMHWAGRFTWYKPTYAPELASHSPGEVLLRALIELADDEGADEFDFTVGDEAFKLRFATHVREVVRIEVHASPADAALRRSYVRLREGTKRRLPGLFARLKALSPGS